MLLGKGNVLKLLRKRRKVECVANRQTDRKRQEVTESYARDYKSNKAAKKRFRKTALFFVGRKYVTGEFLALQSAEYVYLSIMASMVSEIGVAAVVLFKPRLILHVS